MAVITVANGSGGTTRKAWVWVSPLIHFDTPDQNKRFYGVTVDGNPNAAEYSVDGGGYVSLALSSGHSTSPALGTFFKTLRLRITGGNGTETTSTITINWRPLIGFR
jgi:hypothetical protein